MAARLLPVLVSLLACGDDGAGCPSGSAEEGGRCVATDGGRDASVDEGARWSACAAICAGRRS